jgi:hypothetical protein
LPQHSRGVRRTRRFEVGPQGTPSILVSRASRRKRSDAFAQPFDRDSPAARATTIRKW